MDGKGRGNVEFRMSNGEPRMDAKAGRGQPQRDANGDQRSTINYQPFGNREWTRMNAKGRGNREWTRRGINLSTTNWGNREGNARYRPPTHRRTDAPPTAHRLTAVRR